MRILYIVILIFCMSSLAFAEPSDKIRYLMREPLSLFDWGIYRLEKGINSKGIADTKHPVEIGYISVEYDWDKNLLKLTAHPNLTKQADSIKTAKEWSIKAIRRIKQRLFVNPDTGKPADQWDPKIHKLIPGESWVGFYFQHEQFKNPSEPEGLNHYLDTITVIYSIISIEGSKKGDQYKFVNCESPLLGTKILCSE